jgi:hypothetical protein
MSINRVVFERMVGKNSPESQERRKSAKIKASAERVGVLCSSLGQLVVIGSLHGSSVLNGELNAGQMLFLLLCHVCAFGLITVPVGAFCAWFSHFWFRRSPTSVTRMTMIIILAVDIVFISWIAYVFSLISCFFGLI